MLSGIPSLYPPDATSASPCKLWQPKVSLDMSSGVQKSPLLWEPLISNQICQTSSSPRIPEPTLFLLEQNTVILSLYYGPDLSWVWVVVFIKVNLMYAKSLPSFAHLINMCWTHTVPEAAVTMWTSTPFPWLLNFSQPSRGDLPSTWISIRCLHVTMDT